MSPEGIVLMAFGIFTLAAAVGNWNWFMNNRKARFIVKIFTREGARYFYGFIGLGFILAGLLGTIGIIDLSK